MIALGRREPTIYAWDVEAPDADWTGWSGVTDNRYRARRRVAEALRAAGPDARAGAYGVIRQVELGFGGGLDYRDVGVVGRARLDCDIDAVVWT
ncbi:hypothetical protein [Actinomadura litoris]|uniref:hypothetical protein n=1 Tax=Actinomadura litoris TaxID=2678616 RepID=UPI001FA6B6C7|nr:hypothetical protein [Actinomadura litoris]